MLSKCFFRCLHDEISSFLEFKVAILGWRIIKKLFIPKWLHLGPFIKSSNWTGQQEKLGEQYKLKCNFSLFLIISDLNENFYSKFKVALSVGKGNCYQ